MGVKPNRVVKTQPRRSSKLSLAAVLNALGDETRLRIVRQLDGQGEVACGQFVLNQPKSTSSHHFRVLIAAGIIARRRKGTALMNRLRRDELDSQFDGLLEAILRPEK